MMVDRYSRREYEESGLWRDREPVGFRFHLARSLRYLADRLSDNNPVSSFIINPLYSSLIQSINRF